MISSSEAGEPVYCDAAEPVHFSMGECALVPCHSAAPTGQLVANGVACVRAAEGPWNGPKQLALLANFDQSGGEICKGDIVGAALVPSAGLLGDFLAPHSRLFNTN